MNLPLSDRMKDYEFRNRQSLQPRIPVVIRIDGRAFHTFLASASQPFDDYFMLGMKTATRLTMNEMQGCRLAYIQSDEVSFILTDYDRIATEPWFDYDQSKIESVTASIFTRHFRWNGRMATFDARALNLPHDEVTNYLLWRAKDWTRNSLGMYCMSFFSHKELEGKSASERHEMLYGIGKNWATDLTDEEKNGTYILADSTERHFTPSYETLELLRAQWDIRSDEA